MGGYYHKYKTTSMSIIVSFHAVCMNSICGSELRLNQKISNSALIIGNILLN